MQKSISSSPCDTCPASAQLERMGLKLDKFDRIVALAGNPNTGKSTVFNALTGLNQHTGNWPGKTVTRAEGGYEFNGVRYKLVDLPGTYSLLSASQDEEVARNFILFGQPDCTIVVTDATALERNLNLALQVMEITDKVVVAVNMMLFSLLHNPCATTIMTIYKETKSYKWATLSVVITLGLAFLVTFSTASIVRLFGGG